MNRYLKANGTKIKSDHKNRKADKSNRNLQVHSMPNKKYIIEHVMSAESGALVSNSIKFEKDTILKASGNHQFKKKEYYSKGTILKTSAVFIGEMRVPVSITLVQKSRVSTTILTAICADETQSSILSNIILEHGRV
jgi:hypothetical protein